MQSTKITERLSQILPFFMYFMDLSKFSKNYIKNYCRERKKHSWVWVMKSKNVFKNWKPNGINTNKASVCKHAKSKVYSLVWTSLSRPSLPGRHSCSKLQLSLGYIGLTNTQSIPFIPQIWSSGVQNNSIFTTDTCIKKLGKYIIVWCSYI